MLSNRLEVQASWLLVFTYKKQLNAATYSGKISTLQSYATLMNTVQAQLQHCQSVCYVWCKISYDLKVFLPRNKMDAKIYNLWDKCFTYRFEYSNKIVPLVNVMQETSLKSGLQSRMLARVFGVKRVQWAPVSTIKLEREGGYSSWTQTTYW